jgi:uncharacterized protein YjbJ (UPF0337 family)
MKNLQEKRNMKSSMRDKAEGKFHQVKGKIKQVAGKVSDNPKLEAEGNVEKISGKVQEKIGHLKKVFEKECEPRVVQRPIFVSRMNLNETPQSSLLQKIFGFGVKEFKKQQ